MDVKVIMSLNVEEIKKLHNIINKYQFNLYEYSQTNRSELIREFNIDLYDNGYKHILIGTHFFNEEIYKPQLTIKTKLGTEVSIRLGRASEENWKALCIQIELCKE